MAKAMNLVGQKFGRLTVIRKIGRAATKVVWECLCDCGMHSQSPTGHLMSGKIRSCGCLKREQDRDRLTTHGMSTTRAFNVWMSMKHRCLNPKSTSYKSYGGRGIKICDRWMASFENFFADMGEPPKGSSIDRFPDVNGDYEPGNCRWATVAQQAVNKRTNVLLTFGGKTLCLAEWSRELGIPTYSLQYRIRKRGLPLEIAFKRHIGRNQRGLI